MVLLGPLYDPLPPELNGEPPRGGLRDLTKTNIIRHGTGGWTRLAYLPRRPGPPPTDKQIACREPMRFARKKYFEENLDNIALWNEAHPVDYFCEAVKRWLAGHSPASSCLFPHDEESTITVTGSATASLNAMILRFTPSDNYALWGIAIIRSRYEIVTPTWAMLRFIHPTTLLTEQTWLDCRLSAGVYHYRFAACEITGRLGAFSPDVFDTVL
jgi:hypothetical protein